MQNEKLLQVVIEDNIILYPFIITPIFIDENEDNYHFEDFKENSQIFLVNSKENFESFKDFASINEFGIIANIVKKTRLSNGKFKLLIQGLQKAKIIKQISQNPLIAQVQEVETKRSDENTELAFLNLVKEKFKEISKSLTNLNPDILHIVEKNQDLDKLCDIIINSLPVNKNLAYSFFEQLDIKEKATNLIELINNSLQANKIEKEIRSIVQNKLEKKNREFFLNEQLKQIQKELGQENSKDDEVAEFKKKLANKKEFLNEDAYKEIKKQIDKFARLHPDSADSSVTQNYLEWVLELPFEHYSKQSLSLKEVSKQLNKDHFGLEKVKQRIEEYFALKELIERRNISQEKSNSFILCFVGPPGIGKTSMANSIAKALKRSLIRIALGGLDDVNELRGHRRTYVGAMPGRIVQGLIEAKEMNPVVVLDEIDKISKNYKGDPSAVLLEILDPEQNSKFRDYYVNFNIDLSNIIFIATANDISLIPAPLRDRMEFIYLNSYTPQEKYEIAKNFLLPQELKKHALKASEFSINKAALQELIEDYTRESGVRNLRRKIASLLRKAATLILKEESKKITITQKNLSSFADKKVYESNEIKDDKKCGIANGLAWTSVGGELLKIEAIKIKNKASLHLTGQLGEVMKESAQIAYSVVKVMFDEKKIKSKEQDKSQIYNDYQIHLHVPQGATPKDGPSAGITMACAIASILSNKAVKFDVAMTGELTLSGEVLAIGGLKEKLIAAYKAKIKVALVPQKNFEQDLQDIPKEVLDGIKIIPVSTIEDVFKYAF